MAKTKNKDKERLSERIKRAYEQGYVNGFGDAERLGGKRGSSFFGAHGYNRGYRDRLRVAKIQAKAKKYRERRGD